MTSHELARYLLSRRDNDLKFLVEVDLEPDPDGEEDVQIFSTETADVRERARTGREMAPEEFITYDSENDFIVVNLGRIFVG